MNGVMMVEEHVVVTFAMVVPFKMEISQISVDLTLVILRFILCCNGRGIVTSGHIQKMKPSIFCDICTMYVLVCFSCTFSFVLISHLNSYIYFK